MANGHAEKQDSKKAGKFTPKRPDNPTLVAITSIYFPKAWNSREESRYGVADTRLSTFEEWADSFRTEGQTTPFDVRKNPWAGDKFRTSHPEGYDKPFAAVTGFRRGAAILRAAKLYAEEQETGKNAAGEAVEKRAPATNAEGGFATVYDHGEMSETDAVTMNAAENIARLDLEPGDLAFAVWRVRDAHGDGMTQTELGKMLGLSQTHIGMILKIRDNIVQDVLDAWRWSREPRHPLNPTGVVVPMTKMYDEIANSIPKDKPEDQRKKYAELLAGTRGSGPGRGQWIESAKGRAAEIGAILGTLHRLGHINADEIVWGEALFGEKPGEPSPVKIKWHKDVSEVSDAGGLTEAANGHRAVLIAAAESAFRAAVTVKTDEEIKADAAKAAQNGGAGGGASASAAS